MTIIAAASDGRHAAIASDSYGTNGSWGQQCHGSKLRRYKWGAMGYTGSYRTLQAVGDSLEEVKSIESAKGMARFVETLEAALKAKGWKGEGDKSLPVNQDVAFLLISAGGKIWTVQGDLAFLRCKGYASVGSGGSVALGALAMADGLGWHPKSLAREAVKVAIKHNAGCGGRVYTMETK
jgi:ATP-dependent protease HslVU (ClpYQ) peptidase subunit